MAKTYLSIPAKSKCSLPLPDQTSFKDNDRRKDAIKFFEYWQNMPEDLKAITKVRVYRVKPPVDLKKIGLRVKSLEIWQGAIPFVPEDYEKQFYHKFGGGDYRCSLEEIGLGGGEVCEALFSLPDWETYPPKVADGSLLTETNAGQEYIQWRARRGDPVGGIKPESETAEGEDFMEVGKSTSPVAAMVDGFTNLATTLVSDAKAEARDARIELKEAAAARTAAVPTTDTVTHAAAEGIKLMGDVTREVMKNSNAPDPVEMFKSFAALMPPPPDPSPMFNTILTVVQESNKTMLQMVMNQNSELKSEILTLRNSNTAVAVQSKSAADQLREIRDNAEMLGYTRNGNGASATPAKSTFEEWGPIIQMGLQIFSPLLNALTMKLAGNGGMPGQAPQPGAAAPAPNPQPAPPPDNPLLRFLKGFEPTFMSHLQTIDCNGFTLASQVLSGGTGGMETIPGRANYNWIKTNLGFRPDRTCGLDALIRTYEPMWNIIEKDLPKYQMFLSQFLNYDDQVGTQPS